MMTRKRTIVDTTRLTGLSLEARLLLIYLPVAADDEGRMRDAPRTLASCFFPTDFDVPALLPSWLGELERAGLIERYTVKGNGYLRIVDWHRQQRVDRPTPSKLPASPRELATPREASRGVASLLQDVVQRLGGKRKSGIGVH